MEIVIDNAEISGTESDADLVVVVGAGLAGLATALRVAISGRPVVVLEASERIGGAAAFSGGQVWVGNNHVAKRDGLEDDAETVESYVRAISAEGAEVRDDDAMLRWLQVAPEAAEYWEAVGAVDWEVIPELADYHAHADGASQGGRYLTSRPIELSSIGVAGERLRNTPYFPVGLTYTEMLARGRRRALLERPGLSADTPAFGSPQNDVASDALPDRLTFGPAVVGSFLRRIAKEPNVVLRLGKRVEQLVTDPDGRVVGVRAGEDEWFGPVVLATSTFDWDHELVHELHGIAAEDFGSVAPKELRGDAIKLARSVGGTVARIPSSSVPMKPGWVADNETGFAYGAEYAMPHCMIVDSSGERFCDDSYWVSIIEKVAALRSPHVPFYLIWDSQHHEKYGLGGTPPGGEYPSGVVASSETLAGLAQHLGIDAGALERTAQRFNEDALSGEDTLFQRGAVPYVRTFVGDPDHDPNPAFGTINVAPFYGMRLKIVSTGIGLSGVKVDADARVLNESGGVVPGLFAVGSCAAFTTSGTGYNSGFALSRALAHAYLVGAELGCTAES